MCPDFSARNFDFQETYLRHILGFMGLSDVTFVHAENQRRGEQAERGRAAAIEKIVRIASNTPGQALKDEDGVVTLH